jgi:hypothetical protein
MSFDLMGLVHNAMSWFGGSDVGKNGHAEGGASVGAGPFQTKSTANDPLGGLVGGFGPMDWKGAGFGGSANGTLSNKKTGDYIGGNAGLGIGAGYSSWEQDEKKGYSGASGAVAPVGFNMGGKNTQFGASTNVYSGVGGSVFTEGDTAGFKASAVPLGLGNTSVGLNTKYGSANASAGNAYLNKYSAGAEAGVEDGRYFAKGEVSQKMGASDVNASVNSKYYSASAGVGEINKGPEIKGGGYYDSKTGSFGVNGGFDAALEAKNIHTSSNIGNGAVTNNSSIDKLKFDDEYGIEGARAGWDNKTKQVTAGFENIKGGGFDIQGVHTKGNVGGLNYKGDLGSFNSQNTFEGGDFTAGKDGINASVKHMQGMGMEAKNFDANASVGSGNWKTDASAHFGALGNQNTLDGAHVGLDYKNWKDPSLSAGFEHLNYGGIYGDDLKAHVDGPFGSKMDAGVGHFNTANFDATGANAKLDKNGLDASLKTFDYSDFTVKDAHYSASLGKYANVSAKADEVASDKVNVQDAHLNAAWDPRKGISADVKKASYDEVYLKGVQADQNFGNGLYQSHLGLGEGSMNHGSLEKLHASANLTDGVNLGFQNGQYGFLQGKDIDAKVGLGNGAVGLGVGAKEASLGQVNVGSLDFGTTLKNAHLNVDNLNASGWKSKDIHADANVGSLGANVGAKQLDLLNLNVGNAHAESSNYYTKGNASVSNANLDAINVQGGHAGLGWNGKEFLGATGDYRAGAGVDSATANYDLMKGQAGAQFQNANVGGQLNNAHLNLFGHDFAVPNMGAKLNASGGANVDLAHGAANANLSLAGSNVNFGGHSLTLPQWAQAGAGVNLSQGAANVNLGGKDGVGADVNLSKGQFSVDAFGHHVDVAGGIKDGANWVANTASNAAHTVADGASSAYHSVTGAVGGAVDKVLSW